MAKSERNSSIPLKKAGFAILIVNIQPIDRAEEEESGKEALFTYRDGAEDEISNMQLAFEGLGFEWVNKEREWHRDLTIDKWDHRRKQEATNKTQSDTVIECCLVCRIQKLNHSDYENFVLAFASHGKEVDETEIMFCDGESLYLSEIYNVLSDKNCPSLQGKPKILVLAVCRVASNNPGSRLMLID